MEDLTLRQEANALLMKYTNYSSERKLMTLRNKIIKYTKKIGPPPTRAQYEHLLAMGRLRMKEYEIEISDILNRISKLFDDDLIRSNKELFIPTVDHAQYDQDISNSRKRIKYMDQHLKEINLELNSMIDEKKG